MDKYYNVIIFLFLYSRILNADTSINELQSLLYNGNENLFDNTTLCYEILNEFALTASHFTMCSILYARPIKLCENCIKQYMSFYEKYDKLLTTVVNDTTCKSVFISQDRLDVVLGYHDNILSIWNKGNCNACYNWSTSTPELSNETKHFSALYDITRGCIDKYIIHADSDEVCGKCMQSYLQLDNYYKSLSSDSIGLDSVCMDVVDSMNATRFIWSKTLNCCKVRKSPEIIFLCCSAIIAILPLFYYIVLRYCGPIRDLPNVLKQSRFKQTILRAVNRRRN